ncbi:MAG: hypothetical protein M3Q06_03475 [Bacteroidota bacterium]|nr:hypothetical protein [Bacteroidota bacterium]
MKRIYFLMMTAFLSVMAMAQERGGADLDVNITKTTEGTGAGFPWLWVVGGIVFLIVLIALLSGRGGTDRVVEKKTIVRE